MARAAKNLRLLHVPGAGVDRAALDALGPGVTVSLMLSRRVLPTDRMLRQGAWVSVATDQDVRMNTTLAVRRTPVTPDGLPLDRVADMSGLDDLPSTSDIVIRTGENRPGGQVEHCRATVAVKETNTELLLPINDDGGSWCPGYLGPGRGADRPSGRIALVIWVWVAGAVLLVAAGFAAAYLPRTRARTLRRRTAWSAARAAIASAAISRDAAPDDVAEAEDLFAHAELLAANGGGLAAAEEAADCAERADRLWREAAR